MADIRHEFKALGPGQTLSEEHAAWLANQLIQLEMWIDLQDSAVKAKLKKSGFTTEFNPKITPTARFKTMMEELLEWRRTIPKELDDSFPAVFADDVLHRVKVITFQEAIKVEVNKTEVKVEPVDAEFKFSHEFKFGAEVEDVLIQPLFIEGGDEQQTETLFFEENNKFWLIAVDKLSGHIDALGKDKVLMPLKAFAQYCREYLARHPGQKYDSCDFSYMNLFQALANEVVRAQAFAALHAKTERLLSSYKKLNASLIDLLGKMNNVSFYQVNLRELLVNKIKMIKTNRKETQEQLLRNIATANPNELPGLLLDAFYQVQMTPRGLGSKLAKMLERILADEFHVELSEQERKLENPVAVWDFFPALNFEEAYQRTKKGICNLVPDMQAMIAAHEKKTLSVSYKERFEWLNFMLLECWFNAKTETEMKTLRQTFSKQQLTTLHSLLIQNHCYVNTHTNRSSTWPPYISIKLPDLPQGSLRQKR